MVIVAEPKLHQIPNGAPVGFDVGLPPVTDNTAVFSETRPYILSNQLGRTSSIKCRLLGDKRTSNSGDWMSVHSHKRKSVLPQEVEHWSLTTLREKLVKIGAMVVRHGRYVTFQLAEVAVSRDLFRKILSLIYDLRPKPVPA